jgi:hypothetical protein
MDAYSGYNQIPLYEPDQIKTSFTTEQDIFCYRVMPFGLKNAGATYQRLVTKVFNDLLGQTMEVYIDDMLVKSSSQQSHLQNLDEAFKRLRANNMRLNPEKCLFGVRSGKFLGYLITRRGIEANPDQIRAFIEMPSPTTKKQIQKLNGMVAALNRFISRASDKCRPMLQLLKKGARYEWTPECEKAFQDLKTYLSTPPVLTRPNEGDILGIYLATSDFAISAVLFKEDNKVERPIYFTSKVLQQAELRYTPLEKIALALLYAACKFRPYFQAHTGRVVTDQPLRHVLQKNNKTGRMARWAAELGDYNFEFVSRQAQKGQIVADFLVDYPAEDHNWEPEADIRPDMRDSVDTWTLYVDGSHNSNGSGVGAVLISPEGDQIKRSTRLDFSTTNNEAEYE